MTRIALLLRLAAWTTRARAPRIVEAHRLVWIALLLGVTQLWTAVDWGAVARGIAAVGPLRGGIGGALVLLVAREIAPLRVDAPLGRLLRRPEAGAVLLPSALLAAGPALAAAILFPGGPLLRAVGWAGIALWAGSPGAWIPVLAVATAGEWIGDHLGAMRLLVDLPLLVSAGWRPLALAGPSPAAAWRPRSAVGVLVGRDLACLWRTDRGVILGALASAPLPAALVWGLRENGHLRGGDLARAVAVLLCVVALGPAAGLGRLRERLAGHFFPRAWPVSARLRVGSLLAVFLLLLAPTHVAMAAVSGPAVAAPPVGIALLLGAGAVWLATRDGAPRAHWFVGWALLVLPLALGGWFLGAGILAALPLAHAARRWTWR